MFDMEMSKKNLPSTSVIIINATKSNNIKGYSIEYICWYLCLFIIDIDRKKHINKQPSIVLETTKMCVNLPPSLTSKNVAEMEINYQISN